MLRNVFKTRRTSISDTRVIGDLLVRSALFAYAEIVSPEYLSALNPAAKAHEYEALLLQQRDGHYAVILALEDNLPLGFAEIEMRQDENTGPIGVLQRMFVVPESLGRGLGPVLHHAVIETLAQWAARTQNSPSSKETTVLGRSTENRDGPKPERSVLSTTTVARSTTS
jgi:GNAT superfamily N-acetyltransferase